MSGRGTVPVQADLLYKHEHPHSVVLWHQGAQHRRSDPYWNVGIYLDAAPADDGCVRYVPGTQHAQQDIGGMVDGDGWDLPGVVEQALVVERAAPGDWPEDWKRELPAVGDVATEVPAIWALHEPPTPAFYGVQPLDRSDYPLER